jgi:hypothetical protein
MSGNLTCSWHELVYGAGDSGDVGDFSPRGMSRLAPYTAALDADNWVALRRAALRR